MDLAPGHYPGSEEETVAEDETRAKYALELLTLKHPNFMTIYFTGLDTEQHKSGPFSPAANAALERIDALVGQIRAAADRETPQRAFVCVVSDHGFASVQKDVNLFSVMLKNGFLTVDEQNQLDSWTATIWPMGGSAAVMLEDPDDTATRTKVDTLLATLAADPANGIARILTHDEIVANGGLPGAESMIVMAPGYEMGYQFVDPLVTPGTNGGMHGYPPDNPEMRASFFLVGPAVAHGKSLIGIDMRNIAPTIAQILGTTLPTAEMPPLNLK
jgi:predicted AlkP superfamily pyrophosphatase or phosphodiesterase